MRIIVAGISTDVGKTVSAAIITKALEADYYKPVQCGAPYDADTVRSLIGNDHRGVIHADGYRLDFPCSPHLAAHKTGLSIENERLQAPVTTRPLVIEGSGGIMVPLSHRTTWLDMAVNYNACWVLVSRHYLGSINHTMLSVEALKQRRQRIALIIFNGDRNSPSEEAILSLSKIKLFCRLPWHEQITPALITRYAEQWKPLLTMLG